MTFEETTKPLKILPCDRNSVATVVLKFIIDGRPEIKFRIVDRGDYYSFESTRWNSRYFHFIKSFPSIKEAKEFIFSSDLELP